MNIKGTSRLMKQSTNFKTFVQGEIIKVEHKTCVEDRHLLAGFENAWPKEADLKHPDATLEPQNPKNPTRKQPKQGYSLKKHDGRG